MKRLFLILFVLAAAPLPLRAQKIINADTAVKRTITLTAADGSAITGVDETAITLHWYKNGVFSESEACDDATDDTDHDCDDSGAADGEVEVEISADKTSDAGPLCAKVIYSTAIAYKECWQVVESASHDIVVAGNTLDSTQNQADAAAALAAIFLDKWAAGSLDCSDVVDNSFLALLLSSSAPADCDDYDNTTESLQALRDNTGTAGASLTAIDLPNQTMDITGNLSGSVGSVTGAVGSVTGNVGGNVVGSVASVTGNVGGVAGTITTLDSLDTAQDTQHSTTQSAIATAQADIDKQYLVEAGQDFTLAIGPFRLASDHATKLDSGTGTCTRSINDPDTYAATTNAVANSGAVGAEGYIELTLDGTAETGMAGSGGYLLLSCAVTTADDIDITINVQ